MFKKLSLAFILVVVVILGLAFSQPDSFEVQRSIAIKAPPEKIMGYLNDFHRWSAWSPWEKLDPNMQRTFAGPASGTGAVYGWNGNDDVGQGRMEITSNPDARVLEIKLDFIKPFESSNRTVFRLTPEGDATRVEWLMQGPSPFMTKLMSVFVSMDKMIGKDFEKGLGQLKEVAER